MNIRIHWLVAAAVALLIPLAAQRATATAEEVVFVAKSYVHGVSPPWSQITMLRSGSLAELETLDLLSGAHTVAVTPDHTRVWVTQPAPNRITVIDTVDFSVVNNIDLGDLLLYYPTGVAITPDGSEAWVTYPRTGEIGVWNATTGAYITTFPIGSGPSGGPDFICFTPDGTKAYVVDYQNVTVTSIRTADRTVITTHAFGGYSLADAVMSPDGSKVYVANREVHQIEVIRTSDERVLTPIATEYRPRGITISPDGAYLFVGHFNAAGANVNMYRASDGMLLDSVGGFQNARRLTINPSGRRLFVSEHNLHACVALDVIGETLRISKWQDLNTEPGYLASPVGVAVGLYPRPLPQIRINGAFGSIRLTWSDTAQLSLSMLANGRSEDADWWVGAITPIGFFFLTPTGWSRDEVPIHQGPITDHGWLNFPPVSLDGWPTGTYVFGFGVDLERDGRVTLPVIYGDRILMTVER